MTTRLYVQNSTPLFTPATVRGSWANTTTGSPPVKSMDVTKSGSNVSFSNATGSITGSALLYRFVSKTLSTAFSISGTLSWCTAMQNHQPSAGLWTLKPAIHVYVSTGTTNTVRGTTLSNHSSTTNMPGTNSSGAAGITDSTTIALTTVSALAGDCIVAEIGYTFSGTDNGASSWYGGTGATDLVAASTTTANPGWIQFNSITLTFGTPSINVNLGVATETDTANTIIPVLGPYPKRRITGSRYARINSYTW